MIKINISFHKINKKFLFIFVSFFVWVISSVNASATTLLKMTIEDLTSEAQVIVIGTVEDVSSAWRSDQTAIETTTVVKVGECLYGQCGSRIKLILRGGTVGDKTLYIPGMPKFEENQNVLLFLRQDPEGRSGVWSVVGMCQGAFLIEKDKKSRKTYAVQQSGAAIAEPDNSGTIRVTGEMNPIKMPLKRLISRIKKHIEFLERERAKE